MAFDSSYSPSNYNMLGLGAGTPLVVTGSVTTPPMEPAPRLGVPGAQPTQQPAAPPAALNALPGYHNGEYGGAGLSNDARWDLMSKALGMTPDEFMKQMRGAMPQGGANPLGGATNTSSLDAVLARLQAALPTAPQQGGAPPTQGGAAAQPTAPATAMPAVPAAPGAQSAFDHASMWGPTWSNYAQGGGSAPYNGLAGASPASANPLYGFAR